MKSRLSLLVCLIAGMIFAGTAFAQTGQVYNPELLDSDTDAPVLLFVQGQNTGVTAAKSDEPDLVRIKSVNKKAITIVHIDFVRIIEGLDDQGKVLTYTKKEYELSEEGLAKLNSKFQRSKSNILFSELVDSVDIKACSKKKSGSSIATKNSVFSQFRRVKVYNLTVEDSEGRQNKLQVYMETFQNAKVKRQVASSE